MASPDFLMQQSSILSSGIQPQQVHSASDALQAIQRQTKYLQKEIQILLDAHSVGLLAGLGQEPVEDDDTSRNSPVTGPIHLPVSSAVPNSNGSTRARRNKRRPSLSTSRQRLHSSLIQLAELKSSEADALGIHYRALSNFIDNAGALAAKKSKIESSIEGINEEIESGQESLEAEEMSLVTEITTLEKRLEEANSRLKHVRQQRSEGSNRRTARLSSWQGALNEIDKKLKHDVFEGKGLEEVIPDLRAGTQKHGTISVWKLPRERRTVELIKEDITKRISSIDIKRNAATEESTACEQGAEIWMSSLDKIEHLEQYLADEMAKLSPGARLSYDQPSSETGLVNIVERMSTTIDQFEQELDAAESKGWNLLVCIVGAEAEALKQGRDLLQETLHTARGESTPGTASMMTAKSRMASDLTDGKSSTDEYINGTRNHGSVMLQSASENDKLIELESTSQNVTNGQHTTQPHPRGISDITDEEDDDDAPGPEFLVEHDD